MATYFIIETVTREGMITVREAPKRSAGVVVLAGKFGVEVKEWFYTVGPFDFIMKVTAPDDEALAAFVMAVRASGNGVGFRFRRMSHIRREGSRLRRESWDSTHLCPHTPIASINGRSSVPASVS